MHKINRYWINGVEQSLIAVSDRAVQFGDGCFTTARAVEGKILRLDDHLRRLHSAAQRLLMPEIAWAELSSEMQFAAESVGDGVVKATITRGSGGRGYSAAGCDSPNRIVATSAYPQHYLALAEQGVTLALSPIALARNPLLAGVKHLNRLEQVLIRLHLDQTTADEALVLDTSGVLVECCAANLFWRKGKQVFTPDLTQAGVDGIMRQHIIRLLTQSDYQIAVVAAAPDALADADEVLICNALMPVLPVIRAATWTYGSRQLFDFLRQHC